MKLRRKLLPYIPFSVLKQYRRAKKLFVNSFLFNPVRALYRRIKRLSESGEARLRQYEPTGTHSDLTRRIELDSDLIRKRNIDSVSVVRYMEWQNPFIKDDFGKYQYKKEIKKLSGSSLELVFNNYGQWTVELEYRSGDKVAEKEKRTVCVEASEYNIAYLAATLPVIIFTCLLWNRANRKSPVLIGLERVHINYNKLPADVYPFPLATNEELNTDYYGFFRQAQRLVCYIGSLFKMNPEAVFHLYLCDHHAYYMLPLMYANGIPEKNFKVHLLSDGTGSYDCIDYVFGHGNDEKYLNMKNIWEASKKLAVEKGLQEWDREEFTHYGKPCVSETFNTENLIERFSVRFAYGYIAADGYDNIEWILHNPSMLRKKPKNAVAMNFKEFLKNIEEHRTEFCSMLNLDEKVFDDSRNRNKKICILLGTNPETSEFRRYIEATMKYFGSGYDYYLKSHPGVIADEDRNKKLAEQGIKLLDSRIPTEIYMMLNPEIHLAGYLSSAFLSVGMLKNPGSQILSVWNRTDRNIKTASLDFVSATAMNTENGKVRIYD